MNCFVYVNRVATIKLGWDYVFSLVRLCFVNVKGEHCNGGAWLARNAYENMPILSKNPRNPIKLNQLSNGAPIKFNTFSVRDYDSRIFKAYRQGGSVLDLNSQKSRSF